MIEQFYNFLIVELICLKLIRLATRLPNEHKYFG